MDLSLNNATIERLILTYLILRQFNDDKTTAQKCKHILSLLLSDTICRTDIIELIELSYAAGIYLLTCTNLDSR